MATTSMPSTPVTAARSGNCPRGESWSPHRRSGWMGLSTWDRRAAASMPLASPLRQLCCRHLRVLALWDRRSRSPQRYRPWRRPRAHRRGRSPSWMGRLCLGRKPCRVERLSSYSCTCRSAVTPSRLRTRGTAISRAPHRPLLLRSSFREPPGACRRGAPGRCSTRTSCTPARASGVGRQVRFSGSPSPRVR